jgi:hypothetical protein
MKSQTKILFPVRANKNQQIKANRIKAGIKGKGQQERRILF